MGKRNSPSVELEIIEYLDDHLVVLQGSDRIRDVVGRGVSEHMNI